MKMAMIFSLAVGFLLSLSALPVTAAQRQDTRPDFINLEFITVPNVLLVDITSQTATEAGVSGIFTVTNPLTSLYLDLEISGDFANLELVSDIDAIWHRLGLIPPNTTIGYEFAFNSSNQSIQITSSPISVNGVVFNLVEVAANYITFIPGDSSAILAQALERIEDLEDRTLALAETLHCFLDDPLTLVPSEVYSCATAVVDLFDSEIFRDLMVDVIREIGIDTIGREGVDIVLDTYKEIGDIVDRLENIADGLVYAGFSVWRGELVNRYNLRPMTLDPNNLPPWNPVLLQPVGYDVSLQPVFEWNSRVPDTNSYTLLVDDNETFEDPLIETTLSATVYQHVDMLEPNTFYYWRIQGHNQAGNSAWSTGIFRTQGLRGPLLFTPVGLENSPLPRFEWARLPEAVLYTVKVSSSGFFIDPVIDVSTTEPFYNPVDSLAPGTKYYWRVEAYLSDDTSVSSYGTFTVSDDADQANVTSSGATETAIAVAVNSLFMQTMVAVTATAEYAINNPVLVATPEPRQDPLYVAQLWVDAAARLDTETVVQYTCQANREAIRNQMIRLGTMLGLGNIFSQAMSQGTLNIDLSRVTFTLVEQSSSLARIHIQGEIATTAGAYYNTTRINRTVPLIFENNMWKLCE